MNIYSILSSKPHNSHYLKRYIAFIKSRKGIGEEKHHICPKAKSLFPEFASLKTHTWNAINLTLREHYIAHWMLWKIYGKSQAQAFVLMSCRSNKKSSRIYEVVKLDKVKQMIENNPNKDGKISFLIWKNASAERREQQRLIMAEVNKRTKSKPKEIRVYECAWCKCVIEREEYAHKPKSNIAFCCPSHRTSYFNTLRKVANSVARITTETPHY